MATEVEIELERRFFIEGQFATRTVPFSWEPRLVFAHNWESDLENAWNDKINDMHYRCLRWMDERRIRVSKFRQQMNSNMNEGIYHGWRYRYTPDMDLLKRMADHRDQGKRLATLIKTKGKMPDAEWKECLWGLYMSVDHWKMESKIEEMLPEIKSVANMLYRAKEKWNGVPGLDGEVRLDHKHFLHVSEEDPTQVAYVETYAKAAAQRYTRTKLGRYLTKFHPELGEAKIRELANQFAATMKDCELKIVGNDDPDGWEWVYEHAHGFSSCMMYNHPDGRYLDEGCCGEDHPVRCYATNHSHNSLGLAWIGVGFKTGGGKVYARAIVNTKKKTWVRIYGDDRLRFALQNAGYHHDSTGTMHGQVIQLKPYGGRYSDTYIAPYLDCGSLDWYDECKNLAIIGDGNCDPDSTGTVNMEDGNSTTCDHCGDRVDEDDTTYVESDDSRVCSYCLENNYTWAYGRYGCDWFPADETVHCESDGRDYFVNALDHNDIVEVDGSYYKADDVIYLEYADRYVHVDDAVRLDVEYGSDGYALPCDTVETEDGKRIHVDDAVTLEDGRVYHEDDTEERNGVTCHKDDEQRLAA